MNNENIVKDDPPAGVYDLMQLQQAAGYTCSLCGAWVESGVYHCCSWRWPVPNPWVDYCPTCGKPLLCPTCGR